MNEKCRCRQAMTAALEEAALAVGGVVASYPTPDEAVWDLCRSLDRIHERAVGRCGTVDLAGADTPDDSEHPAVAFLLTQLGEKDIAGAIGAMSDRGAR